MVRGVTVAGREVEEEGFVGRSSVLRADPVDGTIGQVVDQYVVRVSERRQYRRVVLEQGRVPLIRVTAKKSVEVLEAKSSRPLVVGSAGALHPLRNKVVLAEPGRVVAVVDENVADGADALGNERGVARISCGEFRDVRHAAGMMIATG